MKRLLWLAVAAVVVVGALWAADEPAKPTHPDSSTWDNLFKPDLSDAKFPKGVWTVEDGCMTASKDEAIWTQDDYENFIIDLEFKCGDAANSGVIVYASDIKNWIPHSVEIQILDDNNKKWKSAAANWKCASIFGHQAPTKSVGKAAGEWQRMTCTCRGQSLKIMLNGELVTDCDLSKYTSAKTNPDGTPIPAWLSTPLSQLPTKGRIGLQGKHGGAPIWFRNVKIKKLG